MSKGLKALGNIHDHWNCCNPNSNGCDEQDFKIIEKELKANEIAINFIDNIADEFEEHDLDELTDKIIKTKKALGIIKEKKVIVSLLFTTQNYRDYNVQICYDPYYKQQNAKCLELEEYDFLKEELL